MKSEWSHFVITVFFMAIIFASPCLSNYAEARGIEGPKGGGAIEGPNGNMAVEGPRGNVEVGTRFSNLPGSANAIIVGDQTYYIDANGVYYLPCDDDNSVYCVVDSPNN